MISWTIPSDKSTTGQTTESSSSFQFYTTYLPGSTDSSGNTVFEETNLLSSHSKTYRASTSYGLSGTTYYASSSSQASSHLRPGVNTFFADTSGETSVVVSAATAFVQTSSTTTKQVEQFTKSSSTTSSVVWTTSSNTELSSVEFVETETSGKVWDVYASNTIQTTIETVAQLSQTITYGEKATVVQANTSLSPEADIIYVLDAPVSWNGYSVASNYATSGTRFTVNPLFSIIQSPIANGTISLTSSVLNAEVSSTISWKASRTTQTTITRTAANFTGVSLAVLPFQNSTLTTSRITTANSTKSFTVFSSQALTFNVSGGVAVTTSTELVEWANSITTLHRQYADTIFQSTAFVATSTTRASTTVVAASNSFSEQGIADSTSYTVENGAAANFNMNVFGPPQAQTFMGGGWQRSKFITTGAEIGTSRGGWLTAENLSFLPIAHGGNGRRGVTVFPTSFEGITAFGRSVTYTKSGGTQSTSSVTVGLSGSFSTTTEASNQSFAISSPDRPIIAGANLMPVGMTVVDVPLGGAYKDAINGNTTSFAGDASALTDGQSAQLRCWQPVTAIGSPIQKMNRNWLFWATPKNVTNPAPGAPA